MWFDSFYVDSYGIENFMVKDVPEAYETVVCVSMSRYLG